MPGSGLILPASCRSVQMAKPIVFWFNKDLDFIMCAGHPTANAPSGYQRVECIHAHEVELWSNRLRAQEKRIREMDDDENYRYEDKIRVDMINTMKKNLSASTDFNNRMFMQAAIDHAEAQREKARPKHIHRETFMAVEAEEGLAP